MLIRTVRKPGEAGTRKLVERFGNKLVCVRYRYDPGKRKRYKTVELIVEEDDWLPPENELSPPEPTAPIRYTPRVGLRIRYDEPELRRQVKAIGGSWDPGKRLWFAPEEYVKRIGLAHRIVR
jgi:hypothetical protein